MSDVSDIKKRSLKYVALTIAFGVLWISAWSFGFYTIGHTRGFREGICFNKPTMIEICKKSWDIEHERSAEGARR